MKINKRKPVAILLILIIVACQSSCRLKDPEDQAEAGTKHDEQYVQKVNDGSVAVDDYIGSVQRKSEGKADSLAIRIYYGSPGVRGRTIWGQLVPYDSLWVTGANTATSVHFSKAVKIKGRHIAAGKYALFTIPGRKEWTIIFNKDVQQHLADDYDRKKDVLRFSVKPSFLEKSVQRLTYTIENVNTSSLAISMSWEKLRISFRVENEK